MVANPPRCATNELPEISFLNLAARPKGWNDASLDLLWRYNLHYFDGRFDLVPRWIKENPKGSFPGWDAYPTSLRIVNWVKWLGQENNMPRELRDIVLKSLKEQVGWLARHLEWHIMANHLLANLKALVIGEKYIGGDWIRWLKAYRAQIREQILPDGGHFERSVMYHAIIFEDVLDVLRFCGDNAADLFPVAKRMLRYLVNMTGPDGKIVMFNDASDGIAKSTEWLCGYAKSIGIGVPSPEDFADFPDTGYTRVTAGDFILFADTAPIGPDYQCGHAHADTFTYELYCGGIKVVSDSGTSEYRGCRRSYERSTAAHNVVEVNGRNSSEVWGSHRVGARARIYCRQVTKERIYACHDGYGVRVSREFSLTPKGLSVVEHAPKNMRCVTRVHMPSNAESIVFVSMGNAHRSECEIASEFGKVEKGICISAPFNGEFSYNIQKQGVL